jgi:hypothetical protein
VWGPASANIGAAMKMVESARISLSFMVCVLSVYIYLTPLHIAWIQPLHGD